MATYLSDIPSLQVQLLIDNLCGNDLSVIKKGEDTNVRVCCAQALGPEIYVGCSNGELIRLVLQVDDPNTPGSYIILSRQSLPAGKAIERLEILPSLSRLLVQSDHQIHFYTLPMLGQVNIKPVRNVVTFAVDHRHLQRPPTPVNEPVDFCVVKRSGIGMFVLRNDRLFYQKEIPLPQGAPLVTVAQRIGNTLCFSDNEYYSLVDLQQASLYQVLPLIQSPDPVQFDVKGSITVVGDDELLLLSWTGTAALGVFITPAGDPVRGTLQWEEYPKAICLDYPCIAASLPNDMIEVHSLETQSVVQMIDVRGLKQPGLTSSPHGYLIPSSQRLSKLKKVGVKLVRADRSTSSPSGE